MPTLDWIGKKAVVNYHREVPYRLFHCGKSKSVDDPDAENLLVQGDNLEALKALRRQARQAMTLEQQHTIQEKFQKLERQQRHQRQEIFTVEDEIMEKWDLLIDQLERRLAQRTEAETLFTIRWSVE